jgi:hypothetical protein
MFFCNDMPAEGEPAVIRSSRSKACRAGSIAAWVVPARPSGPSKEPADSAIQGAGSRRKSEEMKLVRSRRRPFKSTPEAKEMAT